MWKALSILGIASGLVLSAPAQVPRSGVAQAKRWTGAVALSSFGERPAFSPDGTRIALVGKTMGDAYEIDLRTRQIRNLTGHLGRREILRVQYLPNGDYLVTAPRDAVGIRPITPCDGEAQDFRAGDTELTVSCYAWPDVRHGFGAGAYGSTLETGALHRYRDIETEYNEIEGVSRDGRWSAVECSARAGGEANVALADVMRNPARFLKPIDICRLEMKPDGARTMLFRATRPGSTRKANNPVVSPDGKWVAFASSDASANDVGTGDGIYLLRITS